MPNQDVTEQAGKSTPTFFQSYRRIKMDDNALIAAQLLRIFTAFALIDIVLSNSPPNPFKFMEENCYYYLTTLPVVTPDSPFVQGWDAFLNIVNNLVNNTAGNITQCGDTYVPATTIWSETACQISYLLQSNCTQAQVEVFKNTFIDMVKPIFELLCKMNTLALKVTVGVVLGLPVLIALGLAIKAGINYAITYSRRDYVDIDANKEQTMLSVNSRPLSLSNP